jgi:hypothetical protein
MRLVSNGEVVSGTFVGLNSVPAISEVCRRQALH